MKIAHLIYVILLSTLFLSPEMMIATNNEKATLVFSKNDGNDKRISKKNSRKKAHTKINPRHFDELLLEYLIHEKINKKRERKRKRQLSNDYMLEKAADEQARYVEKRGKLTHNQRNRQRRGPLDRVKYVGGINYEYVGENMLYRGFDVISYGRKRMIVYPTYDELAEEMVHLWIKSRGHYKNLIAQKFARVGTAVRFDAKKRGIYAVQVFGAKFSE